MHEFPTARAMALALGLATLLATAPALAARSVQGDAVYDAVPEANPQLAAALQAWRAVPQSRLVDWLSNGDLLVDTRSGADEQLERLRAPLDVRVTSNHAGATLQAPAAQPFHDTLLAYLGDEPGVPGAALYLHDLAGRSARQLVPAAAHPGAPAWAHDGHRLAFSAALLRAERSDLYVLDAAPGAEPRLLAAGSDAPWQVLAWTKSDRALLVRRASAAGGDELLLVDVDSGVQRRVDDATARAGPERAPDADQALAGGHIGQARLAPDDRGVYFISDRGSEFARLRYADFYGAPARDVIAPLDRDLEQFDISADNRLLALAWNDEGYSRVAIVDRATGAQRAPQGLPTGVVRALQFDRDGRRLAIDYASSSAPRGLYVLDVAGSTTGAKAVRWTGAERRSQGIGAPSAPQRVRFPTWDGPDLNRRQLAALVYRPRTTGTHPVLVMLHGPGTQARAQLDLFVQFCVNELRVAVIVPDLRGASGYGRSFRALDRGYEEPGAALDLGALLAWVAAQPDLQRDRIALLGTGAGGTLALAGAGLYADRVRAAISIDGAADAAQLAGIRQPVLLVRGVGEPPLAAPAAEQLIWQLRTLGARVWYLGPRDADGSLHGESGQEAAQRVSAQFLAGYLVGSDRADSAP